jgi:diguanylate cyclase (GGDEF)-like protein
VALAAGALALVAISAGILFELDREGRVHREVLDQLERNDRAENVRGAFAELGHAARLVAALGTPESIATVERLAREVESGLQALSPGTPSATSAEIERLSRLALLNARSVGPSRSARGEAAAEGAARQAEALAQQAAAMLDRYVTERATQINRTTASQLRIGSVLRTAVIVVLVASMAIMAVLFALYRERAALTRVAHLAHHDILTGLPNRAALQERLDQEVGRARRRDASFAILLFDLDGFKAVNDTWGHAAGDAALVMAGERSRAAVRISDTVGRLGGDEFLAVLPDTQLEGAVAVAEKLRLALGAPYGLDDGTAHMTISVGIAMYPRHGGDGRALLNAADAALYEAKREGKNRYEVAAP